MAEKHYDSDWAKAKSRDLVRDMIARTILTYRKPEEVKVLCFPGINGTEILEVYDRLNIPRKNIVGIEREQSIANKIEEKQLGIRLYRGSVEDYIHNQPSHEFDVVSLDYIGPISQAQLQSMSRFFDKQQRSNFVVHTANLVRRDHASNLVYYIGHTMGANKTHPLTDKNFIQNRAASSSDLLIKMVNQSGFIGEKHHGYSKMIAASYNAVTADVMNRMFRFVVGENYEESIALAQERVSRILGGPVEISRKDPFRHANISQRPTVDGVLEEVLSISLRVHCLVNGFRSPIVHSLILDAFYKTFRTSRYFMELKTQPYAYVSESGAPMIGDISFVSYPRKLDSLARDLVTMIGYPGELNIRGTRELSRLFRSYAIAAHKFYSPVDEQDRLFLGNSSKPVLTKKRAIEEFRSGASVDELKERYRGWDAKPLAQWKAHVTMGTYDSKKSPKEAAEKEIEQGEVDSKNELTKEGAIEFLREGFPVDEIVQAYPNSFSAGQLRAFKAHITMGKYQK